MNLLRHLYAQIPVVEQLIQVVRSQTFNFNSDELCYVNFRKTSEFLIHYLQIAIISKSIKTTEPATSNQPLEESSSYLKHKGSLQVDRRQTNPCFIESICY